MTGYRKNSRGKNRIGARNGAPEELRNHRQKRFGLAKLAF
ncbi:hypothetical protein C2R68_01610 [Helicobacter pylori]|nr:hypothetical protein C2R68_01610 [Helicobacter pylori]